MKSTLATVAIAGSVAALAVLNMNSVADNKSFLATPFTEAEREFINFIAHHGRTYGTKEEYAFRLEVFAQNYKDIISHDEQATGFRKVIN